MMTTEEMLENVMRQIKRETTLADKKREAKLDTIYRMSKAALEQLVVTRGG